MTDVKAGVEYKINIDGAPQKVEKVGVEEPLSQKKDIQF